jgi:antitoxin component YwqK of YwqJK toxin-antitoxin module
MKTAVNVSTLFLLVFFLIPKVTLSQNQFITANNTQIQVTPSVQKVIKQAEIIYIKPIGFSINNLYNSAPVVIPTFLGLIMHRQEIMMNEIKNIEHLKNSSVIENEIMDFLKQLAKAHNYRDPSDNTSMPAARLNVSYLEALRGNQNANFKNNLGIDPTKVKIAYLLNHSSNTNNVAKNDNNNPISTDNGYEVVQANKEPTNNVGGHGKLQLKEDESKNEINLFGHISGYAMKGPEVKQWQDVSGNTNIEGLVCPEKNKSTHTYFFDMDTNNIPNDGTDVRCVYFGKDGPLRSQSPHVNNKLHGVHISYSMNGDIRYLSKKTIYVNGQKHGLEGYYYLDNSDKLFLSSLTTYANGKKEGEQKNWIQSNNSGVHLNNVYYYSNDKLNGIRKYYSISSSSGKLYLWSETSFVNGKKNGEEIKYSETGKVYSKYNYKNGKLHGKCFDYRIVRAANQQPISHCITIYNNGVEVSGKCWGPKGNIVSY